MTRVTIVGAGTMGRGIGTRAVAGGHDVEIVDSLGLGFGSAIKRVMPSRTWPRGAHREDVRMDQRIAASFDVDGR